MTSITRALVVFFTLIGMSPLAAQEQTLTPELAHLSQAGRLLSVVSQGSLTKDEQKQMVDLRKHFAELVDLYSSNPEGAAAPAAAPATDTNPEAESDPADWRLKFSEVEKDVAIIMGGVAAPPGSPANAKRQLERFRLELELFFASATSDLTNETRSPQSAPTP